MAAYISRGHAVVYAFKMHFSGFLGWVIWLFIHIGFLTGFRDRVGALMSWWYAFTRDLRRQAHPRPGKSATRSRSG